MDLSLRNAQSFSLLSVTCHQSLAFISHQCFKENIYSELHNIWDNNIFFLYLALYSMILGLQSNNAHVAEEHLDLASDLIKVYFNACWFHHVEMSELTSALFLVNDVPNS